MDRGYDDGRKRRYDDDAGGRRSDGGYRRFDDDQGRY
jgi:hypothetical protein